MTRSQQLGENILLQSYPLNLMGMKMGRSVTVIRLDSGKTVIHSTAKFSKRDVEEIQGFGEPGWLVDATNFHDTLQESGRVAFPDIPYLIPDGFATKKQDEVTSLNSPPDEWNGEIGTVLLKGMPKINESAFIHHASRTLVVADLFFNLPSDTDAWTRKGFRFLSGIKQHPGMSRLFRMMIRDRDAFANSLRELFQYDFDKIIVGHGEPILADGKEILGDLLASEGFHL